MLTWTFLPLDFEVGRHRDLISGRWGYILCGSDSRPVFTVCIRPEGIVIPYFVNKMAVLCLGVALETVCSYISLSAHCELPCSLPFVTHLPNPSYVFTWSHVIYPSHSPDWNQHIQCMITTDLHVSVDCTSRCCALTVRVYNHITLGRKSENLIFTFSSLWKCISYIMFLQVDIIHVYSLDMLTYRRRWDVIIVHGEHYFIFSISSALLNSQKRENNACKSVKFTEM